VASGHVYVGAFSTLRGTCGSCRTWKPRTRADDDFTKDLSKVRVIERFALAVPRAEAFVDITLS
jgi:hypothetical protein